jgi:hypothetical protein
MGLNTPKRSFKMKKIIIGTIIILTFFCFFVGLFLMTNKKLTIHDQKIKTDSFLDKTLVLQIPDIRYGNLDENLIKEIVEGIPKDRELIFNKILTFRFTLLKEKDKLFLIRQPDNNDNNDIILDYREPHELPLGIGNMRRVGRQKWKERWNISFTENNIQIDGFLYEGLFNNQFKLTGSSQSDIWRGKGIVSYYFGDKTLDEYKELLQINWRIFIDAPEIENDDLLKKVQTLKNFPKIESPPPEPMPKKLLEDAKLSHDVYENQPPISWNSIAQAKYSLYSDNDKLEKFFDGSERRKKILYARDKILTDIDWTEIDNINRLPEILFAIDHLVTIEETEVSEYIILGQYRDESTIAMKYNWKSWTKIPLLFLLVYYNDWLTAERVEGLSKLSNRLRFIIEEVKKHGNDSPNKLDEIMISVLSKLSDQERRDYFVKSIKLRNYVKESNNLSLQKLMPNDLPPPPGPPENMRDWYNDEGKLRRGAFVRLEDDPDRGKVLVLLDEDRIEVPLGFDDMSKETKRYITEMLEAQAEDAAESEKNKKQ